MKSDRPYLEHILQAIEKIQAYTTDGKVHFMHDEKTQDAVVRNFEIIGEAVKHLSEAAKALRPEIRWRDIAGLRDVLIHNYMGINFNRVWAVIERDVVPLKEAVEYLLKTI